ncbi:hypothetical protein [Halomonas alimentaria]|nr:hypothetical protein [Halomonas alimentaria]
MKQQTPRKAMGERDKLRQFRELDDAFAEALRELDSSPAAEPPAELESRQPAAAEVEVALAEPGEDFEQRLEALMAEYELSAERVRELLQTLQRYGLSA